MQDIPITVPDGYDGVSNLPVTELAGTAYALRTPLEYEFGHPRPKITRRTLSLHRVLITSDVFPHLCELHHRAQYLQGPGRPGVLLVRADLKGALTRENYQFGVRFVTAKDGAAHRLNVGALLRGVNLSTTSVVVIRPVWGRDVVVRVSEAEDTGDMRYSAEVPDDVLVTLEWALRTRFGGVRDLDQTKPGVAADRPRRPKTRGLLESLRGLLSGGRR